MAQKLASKKEVEALFSPAVYKRGVEVAVQNKLSNVELEGADKNAGKGECAGSRPGERYVLNFELRWDANGALEARTECSCPAGFQSHGLCKHMAALLLYRANQFARNEPSVNVVQSFLYPNQADSKGKVDGEGKRAREKEEEKRGEGEAMDTVIEGERERVGESGRDSGVEEGRELVGDDFACPVGGRRGRVLPEWLMREEEETKGGRQRESTGVEEEESEGEHLPHPKGDRERRRSGDGDVGGGGRGESGRGERGERKRGQRGRGERGEGRRGQRGRTERGKRVAPSKRRKVNLDEDVGDVEFPEGEISYEGEGEKIVRERGGEREGEGGRKRRRAAVLTELTEENDLTDLTEAEPLEFAEEHARAEKSDSVEIQMEADKPSNGNSEIPKKPISVPNMISPLKRKKDENANSIFSVKRWQSLASQPLIDSCDSLYQGGQSEGVGVGVGEGEEREREGVGEGVGRVGEGDLSVKAMEEGKQDGVRDRGAGVGAEEIEDSKKKVKVMEYTERGRVEGGGREGEGGREGGSVLKVRKSSGGLEEGLDDMFNLLLGSRGREGGVSSERVNAPVRGKGAGGGGRGQGRGRFLEGLVVGRGEAEVARGGEGEVRTVEMREEWGGRGSEESENAVPKKKKMSVADMLRGLGQN